uniref:RRM domain-containing protein n=1 Tax=Picocystis salinarum TaxID=88271 RepID=A0A6U9SL28_9CHLO
MEEEWYYLDEKQKHRGPFSQPQLRNMRQGGAVDAHTMVWKRGWYEWEALARVPELRMEPDVFVEPNHPTRTTIEEKEKQFVDDDGTLYVWDEAIGAYVPQMDDQPGDTKTQEGEKKRKQQETGSSGRETKDAMARNNTTSVYVTGLPRDATEEEIFDVFGKFGGIIKKDPVNDRPKIKLYKHPDTGLPKGDGLVTYLVRASVDQACSLLDNVPLRVGDAQVMSVSPAQFHRVEEKGTESKAQGAKRTKKAKPMQAKDLGWGGFDDDSKPEDTTVVLRYMFDPDAVVLQPDLLKELEEDVGEECVKFGRLNNLRIYKRHPLGVVTVCFKRREGAEKCIEAMDGRFYDGRKIKAHFWDGKTNFQEESRESEEEQQRRLEQFAEDLENKN